jgi:hypothetical protein
MSQPDPRPTDPHFKNRVFISCVTSEFEKSTSGPTPFPGLRSNLRRYLTKADCEVKVQEDFRQEGQVDLVEKLDRYVRHSAAVIHLVGDLPGAVANEDGTDGATHRRCHPYGTDGATHVPANNCHPHATRIDKT